MEEIKTLNSLKDIINDRFDIFKDKVAFIEKDIDHKEYEYIKYSQIKEKINGLGTYMLQELNLSGKKVAVIGENSSRWYMTFMAVTCGVGVIVPIDNNLDEKSMLNQLKQAEVKAIVYSSNTETIVNNIKNDLPDDIIVIDMNKKESDKESLAFDRIVEKGIKLVDSGDDSYINAQVNREAFNILVFTSGTSSIAKGVMLSHKNICSNIYSCLLIASEFKNYTSLSILPMHHVYELVLDYLFMTSIGGTVGISRGTEFISEELKIIKPDFMLTVPAIIEKINKIIDKNIKGTGKDNAFKTLKKLANSFSKIGLDFRRKAFFKVQEEFGGNLKYLICGSASLDLELIEKVEGYGFKIIQGYGLTETSALVTSVGLKGDSAGNVGKAIENIEVRIDLTRNDNENSNIGEIIVKGDNVMIGYYNNEALTKDVIRKNWFYTGDMGYFDLRGNLVITGKSQNVILMQNDKKVYPEELEELLNEMPLIAESMVYGKKATNNDNIIVARVTLDRNVILEEFGENVPSDEKLYDKIVNDIKKINRMMVPYKNIKELEIKKDDFVKNAVMKIKRITEIENTNYDNMITTEYINKIKASKKKEKRKIVNVEAKKK